MIPYWLLGFGTAKPTRARSEYHEHFSRMTSGVETKRGYPINNVWLKVDAKRIKFFVSKKSDEK